MDNYCKLKKLLDQGDGSVDNQIIRVNPWDPQKPDRTALVFNSSTPKTGQRAEIRKSPGK